MTKAMQSTPVAADEHIAPAPRVSVQAFCETVETAAAVQTAGEDRRLAKAHVKLQMGGLTAALGAYSNAPTPNVIIIESESRGTDLLPGLDSLAEVAMQARVSSSSGVIVDFVSHPHRKRQFCAPYARNPIESGTSLISIANTR